MILCITDSTASTISTDGPTTNSYRAISSERIKKATWFMFTSWRLSVTQTSNSLGSLLRRSRCSYLLCRSSLSPRPSASSNNHWLDSGRSSKNSGMFTLIINLLDSPRRERSGYGWMKCSRTTGWHRLTWHPSGWTRISGLGKWSRVFLRSLRIDWRKMINTGNGRNKERRNSPIWASKMR